MKHAITYKVDLHEHYTKKPYIHARIILRHTFLSKHTTFASSTFIIAFIQALLFFALLNFLTLNTPFITSIHLHAGRPRKRTPSISLTYIRFTRRSLAILSRWPKMSKNRKKSKVYPLPFFQILAIFRDFYTFIYRDRTHCSKII